MSNQKYTTKSRLDRVDNWNLLPFVYHRTEDRHQAVHWFSGTPKKSS